LETKILLETAMLRLNHYSTLLINKKSLPVSQSDHAQRGRAQANSSRTHKAQAVAKQIKVRAQRWK
jgi:hypothetical protein